MRRGSAALVDGAPAVCLEQRAPRRLQGLSSCAPRTAQSTTPSRARHPRAGSTLTASRPSASPRPRVEGSPTPRSGGGGRGSDLCGPYLKLSRFSKCFLMRGSFFRTGVRSAVSAILFMSLT